MADPAPLIYGLYSLVTVVIYAYLGWRIGQRPLTSGIRLPGFQFSLVWYSLAALQSIAALESLWAAVALPPLALVLTLFHLKTLIACVLIWALVSYLIFLFTGRSYLWPISIIYAGSYVVLQYLIEASGPYTVTLTYGAVGLAARSVSPGGGFLIGLVALLIVPEVVGAALYFSLFFRTTDRTLRYRIGLVSWALLLWFGVSVTVGGVDDLGPVILTRLVGLLAALMVLVAYFPPRAIRKRLGVGSVESRPIVTGASLAAEGTTDHE